MEKEIRGYYLANNGDLCIGKVTTDTAKPCKKEGFEMKWFDSLEDACASTAGKPFKVAPDVSEEDYQNLCNLAGTDKAERKPFDSGYAASLATQIENAFRNGTPDDKELNRLAEAVVRLEGKDKDTVEEIRNRMISEPKTMVRFVEDIGMDMFNEERQGYYVSNNNGDLCIGKVTADTTKPRKEESYEMRWFDSLEEAWKATTGEPFKVAPYVSEEDYKALCNLAKDDKLERKLFDPGYAASLATQIEKAFWNGSTPDDKELNRLAEAVVRLEEVAVKTVRKDYWKGEDLDTIEEIRNWMTSEPRKMVRFVEGIGMDMFDDERRDEYEKMLAEETATA